MSHFLPTAKIIVAVAVFSGFLYVGLATVDPDIWWHLKVGEWELQNNSIPHFDEYSFTMSGYRWVNHEWLVDAGLWWTKAHDLWWLVGIIFSLLAFLPVFFWIKRTRSFAGLATILTAATFMMNIVGIRPQMISIALFFVLFEIIRKRIEGGKDYFLALPVLFFIWANLHGGFAVGLGFLGLSLAVYYADSFLKERRVRFGELWRDLILGAISIVATLINPYGIEFYKELYRVLLSANTAKYIAEWQSALSIYALSIVTLISVFIAFVLSSDFRKLYPTPLFYGAVFMLVLFLKSVRHGPLFLISAMPFMILGIDKLEGIIFSSEDRRIKNKVTAAIFIILVFSFIAFAYRIYRVENYPYPVSAVEFLKNEQEKNGDIRIFNDYGWGGYLIYHAPEIKVFIDGRMPHWTNDKAEGAMKDIVKVFFSNNNEAWKEVFARWQINTILMANSEINRSGWLDKYRNFMLKSVYVRKFYNFVVKESVIDIKKALLENGWKEVYKDDIAVVFECKIGNCHGN